MAERPEGGADTGGHGGRVTGPEARASRRPAPAARTLQERGDMDSFASTRRTLPRPLTWALLPLVAALAAACGSRGGAASPDQAEAEAQARVVARLDSTLHEALPRIRAAADSLDDALRPVALLRPGEEAALRRYLNAEQLARARRLGVTPAADSAALAGLVASGALVPLPDSTRWWVAGNLERSAPYVTPDVLALLKEVGEGFQARLDSLGAVPLRFHVSSAVRTAADQAALQGRNPNAAQGRSTHEFGTTVDVAYSTFAAPPGAAGSVEVDGAPWLTPVLGLVAGSSLELVAARRSRELEAILGRTLRTLQDQGKVMVTLERQEPVFHMTVARRLGEGGGPGGG